MIQFEGVFAVQQLRLSLALVCLTLLSVSTFFAQAPTPAATPSPTPGGDSTKSTIVAVPPTPTPIQSPTPTPDPMGAAVFSGLRFRSIGPAVTSGRVTAFAVDPSDRTKYYAAAASGGVWKT